MPKPESLGAIPSDLPLPVKFRLDPERGVSTLGKGGRTADLHLKGPLSREEVVSFFMDHFRLARWTPAPRLPEAAWTLRFRKKDAQAIVDIEAVEGGGCRVRVRRLIDPPAGEQK
jgi:hypothetical protein